MRGMKYTAEEFKAARQRSGLKQKPLADRLDMKDTRSITRWESEGVPEGSHYLGALEKILGLGQPEPATAEPAGLADVSDVEFWLEAVRRASIQATQPTVELPTRDRTYYTNGAGHNKNPGTGTGNR